MRVMDAVEPIAGAGESADAVEDLGGRHLEGAPSLAGRGPENGWRLVRDGLVLGVILLPETRRFGAAPPLRRKLFDWAAARFALASPAVGPVVLAFFLTTLGFAMFEVSLSLLFKDSTRDDS